MRSLVTMAVCCLAARGLGESAGRFAVELDAGGATNGWVVASGGETVVSPTWPEAELLSAAVTLSCSTNAPNRWLAISFLRNGEAVAGPTRMEPVAAAGVTETQTFGVSRAKRANGLRLEVDEGRVGKWRVDAVEIAYFGSLVIPEEPPAVPPNGPLPEPPRKTTFGFMVIVK